MMFQQIRLRLLTAYLLVLTGMAIAFAVGVRVLFYHVLSQQIVEKLTTIAQGTMTSVEVKDGRLQFDNDLVSQQSQPAISPKSPQISTEIGIEIFDRAGNRVDRLGQVGITLPLASGQFIQIQADRVRIEAVTLPIVDTNTNRAIGYIRTSQSLKEFDENLTRLDLGLSGGILLALLLSSIGGIWLTKQAMQPIAASFQRLQQFTADAAHELRSPLMAIKTNTQVALKYPTGMRTSDIDKFEAIASATTQMTRLTEDLLCLARMDEQSQQRTQVDLTQLLTAVVQTMQLLAKNRQIVLEAEILPALSVTGDRSQLVRVFTNSIENALYYTPAGGKVAVVTVATPQQVLIRVRDTGIGIAPAHLPKIFDRFWRADTSRTQWVGGSGLGLAIVQAIVLQHDGQVTVSSELGYGSCFTFCLPL